MEIKQRAIQLKVIKMKMEGLKIELKEAKDLYDRLKFEIEEEMINTETRKIEVVGAGLLSFRNSTKYTFAKTAGLDEKKDLFSIIRKNEGGMDGFLNVVELNGTFLKNMVTSMTNSMNAVEIASFTLPGVTIYKQNDLVFKQTK